MMAPDFQNGRRTVFVADSFRGRPLKYHYRSCPWVHQEPIAHNILVQVERVVNYRHFDFNLEYPPTSATCCSARATRLFSTTTRPSSPTSTRSWR